jgi:hypothetical protein
MDASRAPLVAEAWEIITQLLPENAPLKAEPRETSFVLTPTGPDTFSITAYEEHDELMLSAIRWNSPYRNGLPVQDEIVEYRLGAGGRTG